jgi:hypothetical protein
VVRFVLSIVCGPRGSWHLADLATVGLDFRLHSQSEKALGVSNGGLRGERYCRVVYVGVHAWTVLAGGGTATA